MMRTARRPAFATVAEAPISGINTTPLIDVLLVLLIMFILTIPIASHSVKIDLPGPPQRIVEEPIVHRVGLGADGALTWDGTALPDAELPARLAAFRAAVPDGVIEVEADGAARYERFDRLLATVKRAGIAKLGFVGNERFAAAVAR